MRGRIGDRALAVPWRETVHAHDLEAARADRREIRRRISVDVRDERLIDAFAADQDVLSLTAQLLLGTQDVSSEQRQFAKAVAYGSLYGAGAATLQQSALRGYGVVLTKEEARAFQRHFFELYPGLKRWQYRAGADGLVHPRTLAGRRQRA